jgi:hypothetical protein
MQDNLTRMHKMHSLPQGLENNLILSYQPCIFYGFSFSSTTSCKVEILVDNNILLTTFNTHASQSISLTLPFPLPANSVSCRVTNTGVQAADAYITSFCKDTYDVFNEQFTKDLEDTLTR